MEPIVTISSQSTDSLHLSRRPFRQTHIHKKGAQLGSFQVLVVRVPSDRTKHVFKIKARSGKAFNLLRVRVRVGVGWGGGMHVFVCIYVSMYMYCLYMNIYIYIY